MGSLGRSYVVAFLVKHLFNMVMNVLQGWCMLLILIADMVVTGSEFLALGWHLEEIHVTWAHLEKKWTRLRTYTKSLEELCKQCAETASQASSDAGEIFLVTAYTKIDINYAAGGNLRRLSAEEAWETIEDCAQCDKQWKNPTSTISDQTIANLKAQLVENEVVRVMIPKCMSWLDAYDEPIEAEETIGIPMEVQPLDHTKLEDLGLNTCSHDLFPSSREFTSVDEPEPQPLPNLPFLDVNL
ncbi:hypothetical protein Tco_0727542 [Tanacetum coccineum]|uniref:Uncharacterized protein n=1 Tax=Tanacetum coccineum TaxID=301880 RepID=A0ABQ4YJN9_9ASTR